MVHTEQGVEILKNFVLKICKAKQDWTMEGFVEKTVKDISKIDGNVLCAVSGGIDSTVTALLIHKAIGERLRCIFVDNGLLRLDEEKEIGEMFTKNFKVNFTKIDAKKQFLTKLEGVSIQKRSEKLLVKSLCESLQSLLKKTSPLGGLRRERFILML